MKFKRNLLILTVILIGILIVIPGCLSTTPTTEEEVEEGDVPTDGTVSVAAAAVTTNDTTPTLTLSSTGATYMAFSGNGTTWSSWVTYATTYSAFNITTGEGCTSGDGTKTVYVKFKNDDGESTKVHDSILLDTVKPTLLTAVYTDVGSGGTVNASDTIIFTFDDEMDITTVTASTVKANLLLSASKSYGTSPTVSWDSTLKICTVTLGASPTLVVGTTTVNPSVLVKDTAGNTDNSTAVTISTTTTVLSSVSISNSAVTTTTGGSTITLTAVATSTASTVMTSSCTFTWSLYSGVGSISTGTTSTATYTPPSSGTGTAVVKVSVIKTGTTTPVKTATASTITVSAASTPSTTADPTKLSVSAQRDTAIYTDVPSGGSVSVYTFVTDEVDSAEAAGVKFSISVSNTETGLSGGKTLGDTDYIYFKVYSGSLWTNLTSDGQIAGAPNSAALGSIQATTATNVTSSAAGAGNLLPGEKIRCYEGETEPFTSHSTAATTIGEAMAITALIAGDEPFYTRTNAAGHESVVSGKDGKILILTEAVGANGSGDEGTLDTGDTITLIYDGNVNVNLPIDIGDLTWTAVTAEFSATGEVLKDTEATDSTGVVLTAVTPTDFADSAEKVTIFNVPTNANIVDNAGGNFVLKRATDFTDKFDSGDF